MFKVKDKDGLSIKTALYTGKIEKVYYSGLKKYFYKSEYSSKLFETASDAIEQYRNDCIKFGH